MNTAHSIHREPPSRRFSDTHLVRTGIKAMLEIARLWGLSDAELAVLLGGCSTPTIRRWRRAIRDGRGTLPGASPDLRDRLSYLLGIYKSLQLLFDDPQQADEWLHRPHHLGAFAGRTPLQMMLNGDMEDLAYVRRYLDAQRGS